MSPLSKSALQTIATPITKHSQSQGRVSLTPYSTSQNTDSVKMTNVIESVNHFLLLVLL